MDTRLDAGTGTTPVSPQPAKDPRLDWLDTLRIALTILVVAHHSAQAYGPADWWYVEDGPRAGILATLSALDGAFFMSLFFFVSAYFVPASYSRRGGRSFVRGRLLRLGVPVLAGALTLVPGLMYAYYVHYRGYPEISFPRYFADVYLGLGERPGDWSGPSWPDLQFGHLWFFQNLLAYSLLYALCPWWPAPSAAPPPPPRASFHRAGCPDTSRSRPSPWCSERARWNTRFSRSLAAGSFAVYVIHLPIVVALQFAVAGHGLPALGAFALVTACAVPVSFAAAHVLRRLPGFRRVL